MYVTPCHEREVCEEVQQALPRQAAAVRLNIGKSALDCDTANPLGVSPRSMTVEQAAAVEVLNAYLLA